MADLFSLNGSYTVDPAGGSPSGDPSFAALIDERLALIGKQYNTVALASDGDHAIAFDNITQAQVLIVKAVGGYVDVKTTTPAGADQVERVESLKVLINPAVPITALKVARQASTAVTAKIFLGQTI